MAYDNTVYKEAIEKLKIYTEKRGWSVDIKRGNIDQAAYERKIIYLNARHKTDILYWTFLHELGHMFLLLDTPMETYAKQFRALVDSREQRRYGTLVYKLGVVEEELAAWKKGYEFAISKKLPMDIIRFDKHRSKMLTSYFKWVVRTTKKNKVAIQQPTALNNNQQQSVNILNSQKS